MSQTSFDIDAKTAEALDNLKKTFGVSSNAAVVRRALALALLASKYADEEHNIHLLKGEDNTEQEVVVPLRY